HLNLVVLNQLQQLSFRLLTLILWCRLVWVDNGHFEQLAIWIQDCQVEMIAIGNGTASRESERFVAQTIK
ncbi:hypothetical protein NE645_18960, partial [Roseburia hominis]|nr:hypothetical protein [Roseburia hominis]